MFKKVIFKNFLANVNKYMLYFLGLVLSVAVMVSFSWMKTYAIRLKESGVFDDVSGIVRSFSNYYILMAGITVVFISYVMKEYIELRIKDYQLLMILGIKRKMMFGAMAIEYFIIWIISFIVGTAAGVIFTFLLRKLLIMKNLWFLVSGINYGRIVFTAFGFSLFMFLIIFMYQVFLLSRKDLSIKEKQESLLGRVEVKSWWKFCAIVGMVFVLSSIYLHINKAIARRSWFLAIFICVCGFYLLFSFGTGFFLEILKRHPPFYYKNILKLNNFYVHYVKNKTVIFILFAIDFIILYVIGIGILDNIAVDHSVNYPYDYVVAGEMDYNVMEADGVLHDELKIPYLQVTVSDGQEGQDGAAFGTQFFGISESDYEAVSGDKVQLGEREVLTVSQREERDNYMNILPAFPQMYVDGQYTDVNFKGQKTSILFWGYGAGTDLLVLPDSMYHELSAGLSKNTVIWAFNGAEGQSQKIEELVEKIHIICPDVTILSKQNAMDLSAMQSLLTVIMNIAVGLFLTMNGLLVLSIKLFSEIQDQAKKYEFLDYMGMKHKAQKKNLGSEIIPVLLLPLVTAAVTGIIFLIADMMPDNISIENSYMIGIYFACCIIPEIFYLMVIKRKVVQEVLGS